jgi:hypothetical protein
MRKENGDLVAGIIALVAGGWLIAGCSAHVSIGETPMVSKRVVENEVATTLAREKNQPVPAVVCPANLKAKVGAVMYCSLTAQGSTTSYPVRVRVTSTSGTRAHFNIQVSKTPGHFTGPG